MPGEDTCKGIHVALKDQQLPLSILGGFAALTANGKVIEGLSGSLIHGSCIACQCSYQARRITLLNSSQDCDTLGISQGHLHISLQHLHPCL